VSELTPKENSGSFEVLNCWDCLMSDQEACEWGKEYKRARDEDEPEWFNRAVLCNCRRDDNDCPWVG